MFWINNEPRGFVLKRKILLTGKYYVLYEIIYYRNLETQLKGQNIVNLILFACTSNTY